MARRSRGGGGRRRSPPKAAKARKDAKRAKGNRDKPPAIVGAFSGAVGAVAVR